MYNCNICKKCFVATIECHKHLYLHRDKNYVFNCLWNNCFKIFSSYVKYKLHCHRFHSNSIKKLNDEIHQQSNDISYVCTIIGCSFENNNFMEFCSHMYNHFKYHNDIKCPFDNCNLNFQNKSSFRCHIFRKHKLISVASKNICSVNQNDIQNIEIANINLELFENRFAKLFLNLKTRFKMTQTGIEFVSNELSDILATHDQANKLKIKSLCSELNISEHQDKLLHTLQSSQLVSELLEFSSNYKLTKHLRSNYQYIAPQKINLGRNLYHDNCFFYYVPILETIKSLIEDEQFYSLFNQPKNSKTGVYSDYNDG